MRASELDLKSILEFLPEEGKILFGTERMLLFRKDAFARLRGMIIDHVGPTIAKSILTKFAFQNGQNDYHSLAKMFRWDSERERLAAGPMMHAWSGIVHVEPTFMEYDRARNYFHFKGIWRNSYEAEIHLENFGKSEVPVCYSLTGYGSGWCSAFFGSPVLEVETKCVARGDANCEWEIRTINDWGEEVKAQKDLLFNSHESISRQLEQKSQDLNQLNASLEHSIKVKTEKNRYLVRVLCHDLLPPLEVIEEFIKQKNANILDNADMLSRLETAVTALRSSLSSVRQSQIQEMQEKKQEAPKRDLVTFEELIRYLNAVFHYKLQQKNLVLDVDDRSDGKGFIGCRVTILQQIFQNLISNAIKFSPRDSSIKLSGELSNGTISISVSDHGIGIPKTHLEKIFSAELKTSRPGTGGEAGSGFGLSIANHFTTQMGGSLEINSTTIDESFEKSGTAVKVSFPVAP